jgi:hypothetical protein
MRSALLLALLAVSSSSCIRSPVAMMTSTRPLTQGGYTELGPVEETDCLWYLFSVFPISSGNDFQAAIRDAIRQRSGDALIQVTARDVLPELPHRQPVLHHRSGHRRAEFAQAVNS